MAKPRVIKKWERYTVYSVAIIVDIVQIILDIFVAGILANRIIDIVVGFLVFAYGTVRKLWTPQKILVFGAYFIGEMVPILDALPFWTLDIKNLYGDTVSSQEELDALKEDSGEEGPANQNGVREPRKPPVLNSQNGVRLPNGGLKPPILGK